MLNDLIKWVYEQGLVSIVYNSFHIVGLLSGPLFNLWYCKKYKISRVKGIAITLVLNAINYAWMVIYSWILSGFDNFGGGNAVKVVVFFPLFMFIIAKIFRMDWKTGCDFVAPSVVLSFGICKIGCIFAGCCGGYPSNWGTYSSLYDTITFPTAALEAVVSIAIVFVLFLRASEKKHTVDGLSFPLLLILFGITRFILEFARYNDKIWLGCSDMSFHALFMTLVGIVMYVIIKRHNSAKPEIAEEALLNSENN